MSPAFCSSLFLASISWFQIIWRWDAKHKAVSRKLGNQAELLAKFRLPLKFRKVYAQWRVNWIDSPLKKLNTSLDSFQSQTRLRSLALNLACQEAKLSPLWRTIISDKVPNYLHNLSHIITGTPSKIIRMSGGSMK